VADEAAEAYRKLAEAIDDIAMYRNLLALLPYTVHVDREAEWMELARRDAQQRAAALAQIPRQRGPIDLRPRVRAGAPRGRSR
jgi:hypothetical protein